MSDYTCPNCMGGFNEPGPEKECPWCGQSMDKSIDPPVVTKISKSVDSTSNTDETFLGKLGLKNND